MVNLEVKTIRGAALRSQFLDLPYRIYRDLPEWTPMMYRDARGLLRGKRSQLLQNGEHEFFVVMSGREAVGRICVGVDRLMNRYKGVNHAYFTLLEAVDDSEVADLLLDTAMRWARDKNARYLKGPISPTNGDDFRGVLVQGFEQPSFILNNYNPQYYPGFFKAFDSYLEYIGYSLDLEAPLETRVNDRIKKVISRFGSLPIDHTNNGDEELMDAVFDILYASRGYRTVEAHKLDLKSVSHSVYRLLNDSMPDWEEDIIPPSFEETKALIRDFLRFTQPGLAQAVFLGDSLVGFAVVVPNYNPIIRRTGGKILPFGWFRFLREKGALDSARAVVLFVSSSRSNAGLSGALMIRIRENLKRLGYKKLEFSTISAANKQMTATASFLGIVPYKRYVVYGKSLTTDPLSLRDIYGRAADRIGESRE